MTRAVADFILVTRMPSTTARAICTTHRPMRPTMPVAMRKL